MRIMATMTLDSGRRAFVVTDADGLHVSVPGDVDAGVELTKAARFGYPGPAAGDPAAWAASFVAEKLGASAVELAPELRDPPVAREVY